jgi:hypothetical protein
VNKYLLKAVQCIGSQPENSTHSIPIWCRDGHFESGYPRVFGYPRTFFPKSGHPHPHPLAGIPLPEQIPARVFADTRLSRSQLADDVFQL